MSRRIIKLSAVFCTLFLICLLSVFFANVEAYNIKTAKTDVPGSKLNVRDTAGTNGNVLGRLDDDVNIVIYGEQNIGDGYVWYKIGYGDGYGYVRSDCVKDIKDIAANVDFETYLTSQGFPDDYKEKLRIIHALHPAWVFKNMKTGIDFSTAVNSELTPIGKSLISGNSISSWKSTDNGAFDWDTSTWKGFDGSNWVVASKEITAYYMDPRNFLDENYIFQFLDQSFDETVQTKAGVTEIIKNTFMKNNIIDADGTTLDYAKAIYDAAKANKANPYVMAAIIIQEQGSKGTSDIISGTVSGYKNIFNYFNVGAYTANGMTAIQRGLWYASLKDETTLRPWNTRLKAIKGGIYFYSSGYIQKGQTTLYLKRFNINGGYSHQYMTNVKGAADEGKILSNGYTGNLREMALTFYIPTYNNMPEKPSPLPSKDGSPNNKLASLTVSAGYLTSSFSADTQVYELVIPSGFNTVDIYAKTKDSTATVKGTGRYSVKTLSSSVTVSVTAQNGDVRYYVIKIKKNASYTYGDCNGDGKIDGKDLIRLKEYLNNTDGKASAGISLGADADGNGVINTDDVKKLRYYFVGYNYNTKTSSVTLGKK